MQGAQKDVAETKKTKKERVDEILSKMEKPDYMIEQNVVEIDTTSKLGGQMKNYDKPGGEDRLKRDFDKLPGQVEVSKKGVRTKKLPNGNIAVDRTPLGPELGKSTLEIQRDAYNTGRKDFVIKYSYK